ncbi:TPA: hypothetical protein DDW35_00245, partial [Candidatus Sumerlaeota bacterium]|nr:hypothetical protein [Candidatus Sumerlaeota bacterium]
MLFFPRLTTIQTIGCLALTGAILVPAAVHADVVLLKNGQRVEGVATQTPGKPDSVTIRGPKGTVELSKDLIQTIQYESEAVNLRRTGDDHYNAKRYKEAIESYQKSLALDPKDELTAKQLKTAQDAIARESTVERRKQIEVINTTLAEAKKKVATKEFDAAEKMLLKEVPALTPTDEQVQQSNEIKRDLYLAWAHESDDKLKPELAVKYYEKVLELDASNKEAYERLIKVMETNPDYNQRVIEAYRVQLKLTPDDSATRRKLADKLLAEGVRMERTATLDPTEQKKVDDELKEAVDTFQLCIPAGIEERKSLVADPM